MIATLILWSHALAALLFGSLALWAFKRAPAGVPRRPLAIALALTSLWALAAAGIGNGDIVTLIAETLRNLAWLGFMIMVHRHDGNVRPPLALGTVYGVVGLVAILAVGVQLYGQDEPAGIAVHTETAALLFRIMTGVASLLLIQALHSSVGRGGSNALRWILLSIAGMWLVDLNLLGAAYLTAEWSDRLIAARGIAMAVLAAIVGAGMQRKGEWSVQVSRTVAYQSLSLVAIGLYFALLALATSAIATVGGAQARVLQTAFVFGSTAAILTLASSPWVRAWIKVKLAKHFFRHRYDYRAEWMRFTDTLGQPEGAAPLDERTVKAIADLTDSPGGALLLAEGSALEPGATWNWDRETLGHGGTPALAEHLHKTGRVIDLDSLRSGEGDPVDAIAVPQWMLDLKDAWVVVPLPHQGQLAGAMLLARPPVRRPLDWEDFDLLKVAGRQVASYLAEARAQSALAEAQRFDEFNRRFAFILHDIKNLVSQLSLTARNAERHADNPEFRADMVATLQDSADRMNALLARLSQRHRSRTEAPRAVDVLPIVERVAERRRGQHAVTVQSARATVARADAAALEQLLGHLVQNAIEASPGGEPIALQIGADGLEVWIDVVDGGCGMSAAFVRDKLFKPFVSSKPGGFGIGAYEARELTVAMDGRLEVTSREGRGTTFRIILKAAHRADIAVERAA